MKRIFYMPTSQCNLRCAHCYMSWRDDTSPARTLEKYLIQHLRGVGGELRVTGGEATLYRGLCDLIVRANDHGVAVGLSTNGYTMDRATSDAIAGFEKNHVSLSIHSSASQSHDALTGVAGSFMRVIEVTGELVSRGVRVAWNVSMVNDIVACFSDLYGLASDLRVSSLKLIDLGPPFRRDKVIQEFLPSIEQKVEFEASLEAKFAAYSSGPDIRIALSLAKATSEASLCPIPINGGFPTVTSDGSVYPCCLLAGIDRYRIGRINMHVNDSLYEDDWSRRIRVVGVSADVCTARGVMCMGCPMAFRTLGKV